MRKLLFLLLTLILVIGVASVAFSAENNTKLKSLKIEKRNIWEEKNKVRLEVEASRKTKAELDATEDKTEGGEEEAEPPYKFPGWQAVFAFIATIYYALALKILPLFIEKKTESGGHH
jgi:hypothetical protein